MMPKSPLDAPAEIASGVHQRLTTLPASPPKKKSTSVRQVPWNRSSDRPNSLVAYIFKARWIRPMCRNTFVTSRHHCPSLISGPKLAPHATRSPAWGFSTFTPSTACRANRPVQTARIA